ncbi:MAG: PA2169 family four-helix-bundle protein [Ilumatobacteraceae bacterium]
MKQETEMVMSTDAKVTKDLMETLEDGRKGFADAAEKLSDGDGATLAPKFREFSEQRKAMYAELEVLAAKYGDDIDDDGSLAATIHRGWMSLKDAVTGSSPKGVIDVAEQGEEHAVNEYDKALEMDLSPELADLIRRQLAQIKSTQAEVKTLAAAHN